MQIKELALRTGLTPDTIRFYEKQGLLDASLYHRHANNYRIYSEAAVERLLLIKHAKRFGFTLSEVRHLGDLWQTDQLSHAERIGMLAEKLQQIDQQMRELEQLKGYITEKLEKLRGSTDAS